MLHWRFMYIFKLDDVSSCELGMPDVVSTRLSPWLKPPTAYDEAAYLSSQLEFFRRKKKRDQSFPHSEETWIKVVRLLEETTRLEPRTARCGYSVPITITGPIGDVAHDTARFAHIFECLLVHAEHALFEVISSVGKLVVASRGWFVNTSRV
jgi:hypothetical protein